MRILVVLLVFVGALEFFAIKVEAATDREMYDILVRAVNTIKARTDLSERARMIWIAQILDRTAMLPRLEEQFGIIDRSIPPSKKKKKNLGLKARHA